jgi:pyrroline-5-carboxylate reductase
MKIGIVGLGTMGEIFLRGMQQNEAIKDGEFFVFDKSAEKLEFCV